MSDAILTISGIRRASSNRPAGYVDDVLSAAIQNTGEIVRIPRERYDALVLKYRQHLQPPPSGPGTELHAILRDWLGIEPTADCPCRSMAGKMDRLGPDWCEGEGMPEILGVMQGEHAKRWADGRTRLPWSDLAARQLVQLACRRARAKASA